MTILLYLLCAYGLVFGLQHKVSFIHNKVDILDKLLGCSYCLGFWMGWASWGLSWLVEGKPALGHPEMGVVPVVAAGGVWAFSSTVFCYLMDVLTVWLEESLGSGSSDD